jgi:hypothetical protein
MGKESLTSEDVSYESLGLCAGWNFCDVSKSCKRFVFEVESRYASKRSPPGPGRFGLGSHEDGSTKVQEPAN